MTLTKFEINDICNVVLDPLYVRLEKSNKLLERIAVALEKKNDIKNSSSETEKELLDEVWCNDISLFYTALGSGG